MKINYHLLIIFEYDQTQIIKQQKHHPLHNNRPKRLLLKASSYLSIGQYIAKHHVHDLMTLGDVKVNLEDVKCIYESNYKLLFEKYM